MSNALKSLTLALLVSCSAVSLATAEPMFVIQMDDLIETGSVPAPRSQFLRLNPAGEESGGVIVPVFRRLASDASQLRFDGEMGMRDLPVYLRPDQVTEPAKLKLRYLSAVSVMPEASRLTATINGRDIAIVTLDASNEAVSTEIDIPPGLLKPGYNAVRFTVQQRHRVDCTIEAAHELWTKLDLAASGLALTSSNDVVSGLDQLIGVLPDETGATPIYVVVPTGTPIATIDLAMKAAQALVLRGQFAKPRITFVTEPGNQPGIHLHVGTTTELRAQNLGPQGFGGDTIQVDGRSSGAVHVYVTGDTAATVATSITRLASEGGSRTEEGTPEGLQALKAQRGVKLAENGELTFQDLGLATQEFNGRIFRTSFNLVLPADFFPADNGKATLYLDGEYVGGLLTTNEALVSVNGKVSGATRLSRSGGETVSRRPIAMTLRALHPGHNTITLEVRTGSEGDRDCNPLSLLDASQRLRIASTSSFSLPSVARLDHLPNLGSFGAHGFPFSEANAGGLTIYMPKPSHAALGAATTLVARTAATAGHVIDTRISRKTPDDSNGATLIVGAYVEMPETLLNHFGVRKDILPKAWRNASLQKAAEIEEAAPRPAALNRLGEPERGAVKPATTEAARQQQPLSPDTQKPDYLQRALGALSRFLQRNVGFSSDQLAFMNGGRTGLKLHSKTTVLLAEAQALKGGRETWLMLTGVTSDALQADVAGLVSPSNWQQIKGRMAAYDPSSTELVNFPANTHYHYKFTDKSIGNVTLVTAGWLSNNIMYYVLVILVLCGMFGFVSRKLLNRVGARP